MRHTRHTRTDMNMGLSQLMVPMSQLNQLLGPMQQLGTMMIDGLERVSEYQLEMMNAYTTFAVEQLRDALEVHDPDSLQAFLEKQSRASAQFSRRLADDTQQLLSHSRAMAEQSASSARESMQSAGAAARSIAEKGATATEAVAREGSEAAADSTRAGASVASGASKSAQQAARTATHATKPSGNGGKATRTAKSAKPAQPRLPIERYDQLTMREIERRLDGLDRSAIRALHEYERKNKNRPRFKQAIARRLES